MIWPALVSLVTFTTAAEVKLAMPLNVPIVALGRWRPAWFVPLPPRVPSVSMPLVAVKATLPELLTVGNVRPEPEMAAPVPAATVKFAAGL